MQLQAQGVATKPMIPARFDFRNTIPQKFPRQQEGERTLQEIQGYRNLQRQHAEAETQRAQEAAKIRGEAELLNLAFEDRVLPISPKDLDKKISELIDSSMQLLPEGIRYVAVGNAMKEAFLRRYKVLKRLAAQEGKASDWKQAITNVFGTEEEYDKALQPLYDANVGLLETIELFQPEARGVNEKQRQILERVRKKAVALVFNGNGHGKTN